MTIFAKQSDCGGTWRTSSLSLRRVRRRRGYRGPALVKTRSWELFRVNRDAFRHGRAGGDGNAVCPRRVRPHGGGGGGNSEQSDSHEPGNRSMPRHRNLLWSQSPLSVGHGNYAKVQQRCDEYGWREFTDWRTTLFQVHIAAQAGLRREPSAILPQVTTGRFRQLGRFTLRRRNPGVSRRP